MEIDITRFFNEADAFEFSASRAERGANAGPETWANAKDEGASAPMLTTADQIDALRAYVKDFGAWTDEDIAAWSNEECNALFIQLVAGDMREGDIDRGEELTKDDWTEYEKGAESGRCAGNIFRSGDRVYYSLSH